jgi:hypothetical protein
LLSWCRTALGADAAFIVDARGLLVANSGSLADEEAEAMGARLSVALQQADELEPGKPIQNLAIDLTARYLTGFRLQTARAQLLSVGLISARPLTPRAGALVRGAFASRLNQ